MATHCSILAWRIPEASGQLDRGVWPATIHGIAELDMTEQLTHTYTQGY